MGAGELPGMDAERTVALTFLRLAPFTEPRGDRTRHELLSEMTSTVSSVFLGLTMGCAQCHDHKYDAIQIDDFYRMQAFFSTVQIPPPLRGDGFQIGGPLSAPFNRANEEALINDKRARLQQGARQAKTKLADLTKELDKRIAKRNAGFGLQAIGGNLGNDYIYDTAYDTDGKPHYTVSATEGKAWSFFTDGKPAKSLGSKSGKNNGKWYGDLPKPDYISLGDYPEGKGDPRGAGHKGAFAEILIYGHSLSGEHLTALDRYVKAKYHGEGQSPEPPVDGLWFWLDAKDIDANAEIPNPVEGARVATWVDKVTVTALGQGDPNRQPKMSRLETNKDRRKNNLDFEDKEVRFQATKTKTKMPRIVQMSDNCIAWLNCHDKLQLPIVDAKHKWEAFLVDAKKELEYDSWPHDCIRHSFCSYSLRKH